MRMEIQTTQTINNEINRYSPLGFRIPGFDDGTKIIRLLKQKFSDQKILEELREPSNMTYDDLTRELKRERILQNNKKIVLEESYYINAIDPKCLSETELAFNNAYDPLVNILSDNDAQIWKATQPGIKLLTSKDQKMQNQIVQGVAQFVVDGKVVTQPINKFAGETLDPSAKNSNIIMQTQLIYQLTPNAKSNITFDIKEPVILSQNVVEKFCKCQKYYEGELMINCSNDQCRYVWFHPTCVGLGNITKQGLDDLQFTCDECVKIL